VDDILDRRNELEGNISLFQNLRRIEILNNLLLRGAFKDEFLEEFYIKEPIKIPRSFVELEDKPYYIPFIEMSDDLQNSLDYETKLDRNPEHIKQLIQDGEQQGKKFLESRLI
jgi:NTE family protein